MLNTLINKLNKVRQENKNNDSEINIAIKRKELTAVITSLKIYNAIDETLEEEVSIKRAEMFADQCKEV